MQYNADLVTTEDSLPRFWGLAAQRYQAHRAALLLVRISIAALPCSQNGRVRLRPGRKGRDGHTHTPLGTQG